MNTLLRSYLSTHAAEDTLFVLWGFSSEDAGLARPSLDALLQQRLSRYLSSLLQQNPCVITAEEFALHADTLAQEFPHIILVQNTCYRTLLPVSVTLTPEMQSGLLSHFDPETPQDTPLPGIEPCLRVYSNLLHTEEGIACCIPLDALLRQYPQVERVSFGAAPHTVPETSAISSAFALTGEADYFCLVQQLRRGKTLCVSADSLAAMKLVLPPALRRWLALFPVSFPERMRRRCSQSAPSARRRAPFCSSTGVTQIFSRWMSTTWTLCIAARRSYAPSPRRTSSMTSSSRQSFAVQGRLTATCSLPHLPVRAKA